METTIVGVDISVTATAIYMISQVRVSALEIRTSRLVLIHAHISYTR